MLFRLYWFETRSGLGSIAGVNSAQDYMFIIRYYIYHSYTGSEGDSTKYSLEVTSF